MPFPHEPLEETMYDQPVAQQDSAVVEPTFPSPAPSSNAPGFGGTSGADDSPAEAVERAEELPEFDPRWKDEFEGLLYLGRLTSTFDWVGHKFSIRTLLSGEIIEVGLAIKKYDGTEGAAMAYQAAVCAAAILLVDGRPLPMPITRDANDTAFLNRFDYILKNWYSSTINFVYGEYIKLENMAQEVVIAMGNHSG